MIREILRKTMADMVTLVEKSFKVVLWAVLTWILMGIISYIVASLLITVFGRESILALLGKVWIAYACVMGYLAGVLAYYIVRLPLFAWRRSLFGENVDETTWRDAVAWILAIGLMCCLLAAVAVLLVLDTWVMRSLMGGATLALQTVSHWIGADWRTVLVMLLWLMDGLCLMTALMMIVPLWRYRGGVSGSVYRVSGIVCVVTYVAGLASSNFSFFLHLVTRQPLEQYAWLHADVASRAWASGFSTAWETLHTYMLLPLAATALNIGLFVMLWRRYRQEVRSRQLEAYLKQRAAEGDNTESLYKYNADDVECFRFLTLWVTCKLGAWSEQEGLLAIQFYAYNPQIVAGFTDEDIEEIIKADCGIHATSRLKAAISNARQFLDITESFGTFRAYVESVVQSPVEQLSKSDLEPAAGLLSDDLHRRGFRQIGPATAECLLQHMREHAPAVETEALR